MSMVTWEDTRKHRSEIIEGEDTADEAEISTKHLWLEPGLERSGTVLWREFTCSKSLEVQGCNLSNNRMAQEDVPRPFAHTNRD